MIQHGDAEYYLVRVRRHDGTEFLDLVVTPVGCDAELMATFAWVKFIDVATAIFYKNAPVPNPMMGEKVGG